jgi:ubiquinone/menaquinone biosynthesis C-methylase UbiE
MTTYAPTPTPTVVPPEPPEPPEQQQYDAVAADYDRIIRPRYEAIAALVVDRVRELTDVRRADVVELSAGTGALTHQLAPLARSYVATDVSEPMMAVARQHDVPGTERVTWLRADVRDLDLASESADLVVSSLGPFQDSDDALAEARRVLRPGGLLVGVSWGDDYRELDLLQQTRARLGLEPRATMSAADLAAGLSRAGYRSVTVQEVRLPVVHASVPSYLDYRQAFGQVRDLVAGDPDAMLRTLAACAGRYSDPRGRVVLDWHLLVMSALR